MQSGGVSPGQVVYCRMGGQTPVLPLFPQVWLYIDVRKYCCLFLRGGNTKW